MPVVPKIQKIFLESIGTIIDTLPEGIPQFAINNDIDPGRLLSFLIGHSALDSQEFASVCSALDVSYRIINRDEEDVSYRFELSGFRTLTPIKSSQVRMLYLLYAELCPGSLLFEIRDNKGEYQSDCRFMMHKWGYESELIIVRDPQVWTKSIEGDPMNVFSKPIYAVGSDYERLMQHANAIHSNPERREELDQQVYADTASRWSVYFNSSDACSKGH